MNTKLEHVARALPEYELDAEIGRGQFGIVWRGRHRQLNRVVAIKQLAGPETANYTARFQREARVLAQMDHPHVVTVYDYREHDELRLLVMEFLAQGTLAAHRATGMSVETAIASTLAAASGLHHAHEHGILHRDVKPENLMFDSRDTVKVTDFGIAGGDGLDATSINLTHAGEFFGTPAYVSPEQAGHALGEGWTAIDAASDQYSLAAVLYELLSGQLTHDSTGGAVALCTRRMSEEARPLSQVAPSIPAELAAVVSKALCRFSGDRYSSTEAFAVALGAAATRSLGPDWLERSAVQLRDTGAILDAAVSARRHAHRDEPGDLVVPLPARLSRVEGGVFAGRTEQCDRWDDAWKRVRAGERDVWLVGGEAGIGKTTLVGHLASRAHHDGAVVLYGRCDEDLGMPYQPWIEALSALVSNAPARLIGEHVAARGGELVRLVPELSARAGVAVPVPSDAEAQRYALFGAVTDMLSRAAALAPIVVVLEDLHWADKPTVQLLRHLVGVVDPMRLMLVGTYRPTDLGALHPLTEVFAPLRRESGVEFVDLAGLGDIELLELMEAIAGHELDADGLALRDAIAAETNGNAFFAIEIMRHLTEIGVIARHEGRWVATADIASFGLPVSVRQVVGERVARLGPDAQRLLRMAAVIGRDFDLGLLAEVADVDEDEALDLLDNAVGAALVYNVGPDRYSFAHALVEHTLYDDLTPSRRGRAHRRIGLALEMMCGPDAGERIGELAYHWSAALVPDDAAKAIDFARQAGDRALTQLAPDEGVRWFEKALQLHDAHGSDERQHVALLVSLGDAQRQAGDPAHRDTLLAAAAAARAVGDDDLLIAAALANSRGWASLTGTVDTERIAVLEAALDAVGPHDSGHRSQLLATLVAELTFDNDLPRRRAVADEAIAIARRIDDPRAIVAALNGLLSLPDRAETDHLQWADEAIDLANQLDDPVSLATAMASAATSAVSFADRARFERYADICSEAAARVGQPALTWRAIGVRSLKAILDGDLDEAESLAGEILPTAVEMGYALLWYGSLIITIRGHQGRGGDIRPMVEGVAGDPNAGSASELARAGLLLTDVQSGDYATARTGFDEQAQNGFSARDDQLWLTHVCINAHVCARLADRERAAVLLDALEPAANLVAATASICLFSASACAGMLAALLDRHADADRHFANAIGLTTRLRAPYLIATAELEWARALLQRTPAREEPAGTMLANALVAARRHGYTEIEREALALQSLLH